MYSEIYFNGFYCLHVCEIYVGNQPPSPIKLGRLDIVCQDLQILIAAT